MGFQSVAGSGIVCFHLELFEFLLSVWLEDMSEFEWRSGLVFLLFWVINL